MEKLIDIIIPAYKAHTTIKRTLSSIAMQTISDKVQVTIVNDCDGVGYKTFVEYFSKMIDIQEIDLDENCGPGVARQVGIDNTSLPYIIFMDADDTFINAYAIESILECAKGNEKSSVLIFPFLEANKNDKIIFNKRNQNLVWLFSKLYNREFLIKNNIRFNKSRGNEDVYFNTLLDLSLNSVDETPIFFDTVIYMWHYNENSITRKNNHEFFFNESLIVHAKNSIEVFTEAKKRKNIKKQIVNRKAAEFMVILYYHYLIACKENPIIKEELFNLTFDFYKKFYYMLEFIFGNETLKKYNLEDLRFRRDFVKDMIPELTYNQFIDKLREELEKQEVTDD